jgi:tetratricopeptide (TPR) repeat protein
MNIRKKISKSYFWAILALLLTVLMLAGCGKSQPMSTQALMNTALSEASRGEWEDALDRLETVCSREPHNISALVFKALAYEGCGKNDLAFNTARTAVKIAPTNFQAQYTLGRLYANDKEKMQDAITPLLRALELKPGDTNTLLLLGRCSSTLKLDSAIKYYRELAANPKFKRRAELWNEMAVYYAERKQIRPAAKCFVKAYKLSPSTPMIVLNFATFIDQYAGDSGRALKFYRRYLKITTPSPSSESQRQRVEKRIQQLSGAK